MKSLKEFFKNTSNILFLCLLVIIITVSVVLFTLLKKSFDKIEYYGTEISRLSDTVGHLDKAIEESLVQKSSAELLMNNTNRILSTVYFGTADIGEQEEAKDFTAFSIIYNEKFYIITAGHCIEMDGEKYSNWKFKSNKSKNWIEPALLDFKSDYKNNIDYAIFYQDRLVTTGLIPAKPGEDMTPQYVIGNLEKNLNLIKRYNDAREGESGSPILNSSCHVIGLMIKRGGTYTPIEIVLDALAALDKA